MAPPSLPQKSTSYPRPGRRTPPPGRPTPPSRGQDARTAHARLQDAPRLPFVARTPHASDLPSASQSRIPPAAPPILLAVRGLPVQSTSEAFSTAAN